MYSSGLNVLNKYKDIIATRVNIAKVTNITININIT